VAVAVRIFIDSVSEHTVDLDRRDESFAHLCARWRNDLVALCRLQLGAGGDAEAIAQEALVRAWLSLDRYSTARPFWPWVATIARRLCIDQLRRRQCEQKNVYHEYRWQATAPEEPEFEAERQEEQRAAWSAYKRLRPRDQRLIGRRHIEGWSLEQLAMLEGITVDATRTALKRAHTALRESYERAMSSSPVVVLLGLFARWRRRLNSGAARGRPAAPLLATRGGEFLMLVLAVAAVPGGAPGTATRNDSLGTVEAPAAAQGTAAPLAQAGLSSNRSARAESTGLAAPAAVLGTATASESRPGDRSAAPLAFDRVSSPEDADIGSIAVSPNYERDGVVFASGVARGGCTTYRCPVLFVSRNRGATWKRLAAGGFDGGRLLLPPSYPADDRIFAAGPTTFQMSTDSGLAFQPLAVFGGDAAMSPGFSGRDKRVLIGSVPRWAYNDADGLTEPADIVVPSSGLTEVPEFAPDVLDGSVVFIGGTTQLGTNTAASAVFRCDHGACATRTVLPELSGAARVRVSPAYTKTGEVFAWRGERLFRSRDGGVTFERIALPIDGAIRDLRFGPGSVRYLAAVGSGGSGALLKSTDGGDSWSVASGQGVETVELLSDGRVLVGLQSGGLACSQDEGESWQPRCA
jgi:RNA polymerase sigma-70 factor (ECF subfamily)